MSSSSPCQIAFYDQIWGIYIHVLADCLVRMLQFTLIWNLAAFPPSSRTTFTKVNTDFYFFISTALDLFSVLKYSFCWLTGIFLFLFWLHFLFNFIDLSQPHKFEIHFVLYFVLFIESLNVAVYMPALFFYDACYIISMMLTISQDPIFYIYPYVVSPYWFLSILIYNDIWT